MLAFAGMIALASAGLTMALHTSELLFYGIKILGAAYLFYLACQLCRANPEAEAETTAAKGWEVGVGTTGFPGGSGQVW